MGLMSQHSFVSCGWDWLTESLRRPSWRAGESRQAGLSSRRKSQRHRSRLSPCAESWAGCFQPTDFILYSLYKGGLHFCCPACRMSRSSAGCAQKTAKSTEQLQSDLPKLGFLYPSPGIWFYSSRWGRTPGLIGLKAGSFMQLSFE